jgi:membrane fusion protein (multidrug efflux system)
MMKRFFAKQQEPTVTVSTMKASYEAWQPTLKASGSTRAVTGVFVTAQLAGMIQTISFKPGARVEKGDVLVQQNADTDIAQLHVYQANAALAKITYNRDKAQYKFHAVSKQQLDTDEQNLKSLLAQVEQQASTVLKKTITAPFAGKLGISKVNPGQYLNPGDQIVMLQTFDPIYVDFYLPQQTLAQLAIGQDVTITTETFPGKTFAGKITTINPAVDTDTRNVEVEATMANPTMELAPGMFTTVEVNTGAPKQYLTLPQTAVNFNTYGDLIYLAKESGKTNAGKPVLIARQAFVETGGTRGDQIIILKGVKEGDTVITSGQLKLKNGTPIVINNTIQPSDSQHPSTPNEHEG